MTVNSRSIFLSVSLVLAMAAFTPAIAQSQAPPAEAAPAQPSAPAEPAQAAPAPPTPDAAVQAPAPTPPAPAAAAGPIAPPPAGKGQIVFFRPSRFVGAALSFSVHEGDTGVGKLGNGSYFLVIADPGPHAFSIQGEVTDTLNMEVEAGETQYVTESIGVGLVMARPHLTPSDQATFDGMAGKLKLSTKKPSDLKPKAS